MYVYRGLHGMYGCTLLHVKLFFSYLNSTIHTGIHVKGIELTGKSKSNPVSTGSNMPQHIGDTTAMEAVEPGREESFHISKDVISLISLITHRAVACSRGTSLKVHYNSTDCRRTW